jgi:ABC-type branched-subunit amino acid transport system permease subunit
MAAEIVLQQVVGGLALGFIYALIALGFTMMLRATELVNFSQGELVMAGAFIGYTLLIATPLPYIAVFVIAAALTGVLGVFIELLTLRVIRRRRSPLLNLIIATVGIGICLRILAQMIWGAAPLRYPDGVAGSGSLVIAGLPFSQLHLVIIVLGALAMLSLHLFFQHTLIGTAWRAAAADSDTAELMGISFDKIVTLTFGVSSALAGGAGVLIAPLFLVGQDLWLQGPKAFAAAALGQFQVFGTMLGGPVLGVMEAIAAGYVSSAYKNAIAYGATIVVLMMIAIPRMPAGGGAPPRHARTTMLEAVGIAPRSERAARMVGAATLLAGMLLLPFLFDDYSANVLTLALVYAVAALGLQLVIGFGGAIIVGFAAFLGIGAYASAIAATNFALPFPIPLILAAALAGLTGLIFGPMLRLPTHYCAIATLGFGEICHLIFVNWQSVTNGMSGISGIPKPRIAGYEIASDHQFYFLALAILVAVYVALRRLVSSRYGRALISARENELAALSMGVDVRGCRTLAFAIAAGCAGISGSLFAYFFSYVSPDSFTLVQSIAFLTMVVIGGLGSFGGALAGAAMVVCLPEFTRVVAEFRILLYGLLITSFMMFLPGGLADLVPRLVARVLGHARAKVMSREIPDAGANG